MASSPLVMEPYAVSSQPSADPATFRFRHEFPLAIPSQPRPVKAVAALKVHLGVPEIDRLSVFLPSAAGRESVVEFGPRTDVGRRALREIRGPHAGAIRRRAFQLSTADAELALIASW